MQLDSTKIDIEPFQHESWTPIYIEVKRSKVTKTLPVWVFSVLWVLAYFSYKYVTHALVDVGLIGRLNYLM